MLDQGSTVGAVVEEDRSDVRRILTNSAAGPTVIAVVASTRGSRGAFVAIQ